MKTFNLTTGKTSLMSKLVKLVCSVAFMGMLTGTAYAGPILGTLSYSGGFVALTDASPGPGYVLGDLSNATFLDFFSPSGFTFGTGALSHLTGSGTLDLFDFAISPFGSPSPVWTDIGAGDITFTLTSLTIVEQSTEWLKLSGGGLFTGTGFDATDAIWSLTAQDRSGGADPILTFSASSAVSEPSLLTLLGLSLLGVGLTRRRKVRKTA